MIRSLALARSYWIVYINYARSETAEPATKCLKEALSPVVRLPERKTYLTRPLSDKFMHL
jgi:hypothetical protein